MKKEAIILLTEDDDGHAGLIQKNLSRSGIENQIIHFNDGQKVLDFLKFNGEGPHRKRNTAYLLLLDIRLPEVDGKEVLLQLKADAELCKIPVVMLTTTDNPEELAYCSAIGSSLYIVKPIEYQQFSTTIRELGKFLSIVEVPKVNGGLHQDATSSA